MSSSLHDGPSALEAITNEDPQAFFASIGNRTQILIFTGLTLVLTLLAVAGITYWVRKPTTLTFTVAADSGIEARFAAKLATVLQNEKSKLRVVPVNNTDADKMVSRFGRKQADLALVRTDVKPPARARAVAIIDKDVMLIVGPKGSKIKNLSALAGKKIAVLGDNDSNEKFVRQLLTLFNVPTARITIQTVPANSSIDKLLTPGNYALAVTMEHLSKLASDKTYERLAQRGFVFHGVDEAKAIERKMPGTSDETLDAGLLSTTPLVPSEDVDTIGLQWMLVGQSTLSEQKMAELARMVLENKSELAIKGEFADKIEPADTDKDSFIVAHPGAAQYINDDIRTWVDRYSDLGYLVVACLSVIGSIFIGLYTAVTRIAPEKAGKLSADILDIGERLEQSTSLEEVDALQDEFEAVLRRVLNGLRDGSVSADGLETFRLGYDFVRAAFELHRQKLSRRGGRDLPSLVQPAAQSA